MTYASRAVVLAACLATGCAAGARRAQVTNEVVDEDMASPVDFATARRDLAVAAPDFATPSARPADDLGTPPTLIAPDLASRPADMGSPASTGSADLMSSATCAVRINELATGTTTSGYEEFIELFNPCPTDVDLRGFALVYRSAGGSANINLYADVGKTIPSNGFLLFAGSGYYAATRDGVLASGMAENGGGVALVDAGGAIVDSVGWGTATNAFVQGGVAAPAPGDRVAPGRSIARSPDGKSSGTSGSDFAVTTRPTPKASNQVLAP
jgi:hypothetical protein